MTQEDKELLLKDLCARLPYKVKIRIQKLDEEKVIDNEDFTYMWLGMVFFDNPYHQIKPYLRPMSSMTEEEKEEYEVLTDCSDYTYFNTSDKVIDWLNTHYFDYRGLIEKGLAIKVTEENNPYKE